MRHARADYEAIQPWPVHRPHTIRDAATRLLTTVKGTHDRTVDESIAAGRVEPIIPDDEPVFLIRGQDPAGGDAVRAYADIAEGQAADPALVALAREWADQMDTYCVTLPRAVHPADLPSRVPEAFKSPTDHPDRLT